MAAGAAAEFGEAAPEVLAALNDFLLSMPLAARCPNGVFLAHSLPAPARLKVAGTDILAGQGPFRPADIHHSGPVYEWTWGRGLTPEHLETLAGRLGAEYFILGHHHIDDGYEVVSPRGITINTDHHPAYFVEFASDAPLAVDTVPAGLRALHTV